MGKEIKINPHRALIVGRPLEREVKALVSLRGPILNILRTLEHIWPILLTLDDHFEMILLRETIQVI
jgi:hypothetical protein